MVPDNFIVQGDTTSSGVSGLRVQINLTYPQDPDLSATLYYDMGQPGQVAVPLFSGVGSGIKTANFTNTIFDDNATTPIQSGQAPFFATFNPQMPLTAFQGLDAKGTWTLVVSNATSGSGSVGKFNGWSLSFQKPLPTTGLGEQGSDNTSDSFSIFTLGQTDGLSSEQWTAVGPAAITGAAGQVSAIAVDPSDASGNTVYAGRCQRWDLEDDQLLDDGPQWSDLYSAHRLRAELRNQYQHHRDLPAERRSQSIDYHRGHW